MILRKSKALYLFGGGGGGGNSAGPAPQAPPYTAPPPYQNAPAYQQPDPMNSPYNQSVPQVESGAQTTASALGVGNLGSSEQNLEEYAPWLGLQNAPMDQANMAKASNYYLQTQGYPQEAQDAANLQANGQGGSSYAGSFLGGETGMNDLNAFQAAQTVNQNNFNNQLNARQSLYSGPIGLESQQNAYDVARGLGIANLTQQGDQAQNSYNLANNQGLNSYNLGANENHNQYNQGVYGTQGGIFNNQVNANTSRANNQNSGISSNINASIGAIGSYLS
jgi:hypothetical protein